MTRPRLLVAPSPRRESTPGSWLWLLWIALLTATPLVEPVAAQLPATQLNTLAPAGGKQGATVEVKASGANLDMATELIFSHPGIKAEIKQAAPNEFLDPRPTPGAFEVAIAADVPPGAYEARLAGKYGVSNSRLFVVGDQDELADNNANRSIDSAQELPLNTVVNGTADGSQTDYYKVSLKKGQRILVDCHAWRIDSRLDPVLTIHTEAGDQLAQSHDYEARDPFIDFTAPADGAYLIGIRDFLYGGGGEYLYRLRAHSQPHVDFAVPSSVPAGQAVEVTLYGRNLPGGKPSEYVTAQGAVLDALTTQVKAPSEAAIEVHGYTELASSRLRTFPHIQGDVRADFYVARASDVAAESGDNDAPSQPTSISAPVEVTGQFFPAADVDWYQFEAKEGDVFWLEVISHRLGLPTDPSIVIQRVDQDDKGEEQIKEVAFVDDPSDRNGRVTQAFDTSTDDPSYKLTVPSDGVYRIRVTDQFGGSRVDPRMIYRLAIRKPSPDFRGTAFAKQIKVANANQVPVYSPQIRHGGALALELRLDRIDGFEGEITVRAEGLPPSITCPEAVISPEQSSTSLIFSAAPDAEPWTGPVRLTASAEIDGKTVTRDIPIASVIWGTANRTQTPPTFRLLHNFVVSVIGEDFPATVEVGEQEMLETSLGGSIEVPVKVERRAGHAEDLKLTAVHAANEFKPGDVTVKKDAADGKLTIAVKNNAKPGVYCFHLRSDTKVKYQNKPEAVEQAEADQKKLDEAVKTAAETVKQATEKANQTKAAAAKAKAEATQADAADKAAQAAVKTAQAAADAAKKKSDEAAAAAAAKPDDEQLKQAAAAAQAEADKAQAALDAATQAAAADAEKAKTAKAAADAATKAETAAAAELKAAQDKSKRATDAKKAADKAVADAKKAAAAKDVNLAVVSTPIRLRIVQSPIEVTAAADGPLKAEEQLSIPVKLDKKYGFDENVDISVELPKGVAGLTAAKLQIPKGKAEGTLELTANKQPTAGEHVLRIVAKSKFNNVNVEGGTDVTITVPAEEAK